MSTRDHMAVRVSSFSAEQQRRQLEESIAYWQAAGPRAIWDATCEITAEWFLVRGIDPTTQRVDKTVGGIVPVPWADVSKPDEDA
jgi:hypothetical protein